MRWAALAGLAPFGGLLVGMREAKNRSPSRMTPRWSRLVQRKRHQSSRRSGHRCFHKQPADQCSALMRPYPTRNLDTMKKNVVSARVPHRLLLT